MTKIFLLFVISPLFLWGNMSTIVPLSFHKKNSYLGLVQGEDGLWSGITYSAGEQYRHCPHFYNLTGNYSFVLAAEPFVCETQYKKDHPFLENKRFKWVSTQSIFNALHAHKRWMKIGRKSFILLDNQLFNALRTQVSLERLNQLLPSYGGVCMVDVCCQRD